MSLLNCGGNVENAFYSVYLRVCHRRRRVKGFKTLGSDFISDTMTVAKCVLSPIFYFKLECIALQYHLGFFCKSAWINHKYIRIPSLLSHSFQVLSLKSAGFTHWTCTLTHIFCLFLSTFSSPITISHSQNRKKLMQFMVIFFYLFYQNAYKLHISFPNKS